jgi:hypothetical protein
MTSIDWLGALKSTVPPSSCTCGTGSDGHLPMLAWAARATGVPCSRPHLGRPSLHGKQGRYVGPPAGAPYDCQSRRRGARPPSILKLEEKKNENAKDEICSVHHYRHYRHQCAQPAAGLQQAAALQEQAGLQQAAALQEQAGLQQAAALRGL